MPNHTNPHYKLFCILLLFLSLAFPQLQATRLLCVKDFPPFSFIKDCEALMAKELSIGVGPLGAHTREEWKEEKGTLYWGAVSYPFSL